MASRSSRRTRGRRARRNPLRIAAVAALAAVAVAGVGLGLQRRVVYPRPPRPAAPPQLPSGAETAWLGQDQDVEAWLLRPAGATPFPVVLFLHGNGELIDDHVGALAPLTEAGMGVLLVEYPGYGRSGGRPSERSITAAALAAFDYLRGRADVDGERIVAHGRSIGGGAACALAARRPVAALVLESTFTAVGDVVPWLPRALLFDRFDNLAVVASGASPVLVLHGKHDPVIPYAHAEALARAAGTEPVSMPCGHNDCPTPLGAVLRFLSRHGIVDRTGE